MNCLLLTRNNYSGILYLLIGLVERPGSTEQRGISPPFLLEPVKINLRRVSDSHAIALILLSVVALLGPDVQHHADGEEIEVANGYPDLHTPQQEQRRRYLPAAV